MTAGELVSDGFDADRDETAGELESDDFDADRDETPGELVSDGTLSAETASKFVSRRSMDMDGDLHTLIQHVSRATSADREAPEKHELYFDRYVANPLCLH